MISVKSRKDLIATELCFIAYQVDEDGVKFVQITDVDAKTLDKILRHIYNVDIEEKELDAKLLEAAKYYKVWLVTLLKLITLHRCTNLYLNNTC